jgi:nucleoside-diphosphate-sugar epimerase
MQASNWNRAIVTGAGGFIGQHMTRHLRKQGVETLAVDRCLNANKGPVEQILDLAVPEVLDAYLGKDVAVFHLAGSADVRGSATTPSRDFQDNVLATLHVLESACRHGAAALLPSTGSVCGPQAFMPLTETSPVRPSSPYAAAKLAVEAYGFAYHRSYGLDVRIARMFSIYGPGMRRFAIHDFFKRLRDDPTALVIRGDGGQTRDYLYIEDTVAALYRLMRNGEPGEVYNVAGGKALSIVQVHWRRISEGCVRWGSHLR